mgnify:CR=1 FL=1
MLHTRRMLVTALLLAAAAALAACSAAPGTPPPEEAAQPTPTLPPASPATPTPAPTSTAQPTATPQPDLEVLLPQASALCENAQAAPAAGAAAQAPMMALFRPDADLDWVYESWSFDLPHITAKAPEDVRTLICVQAVFNVVGSYTDGARALQTTYQVGLLRWPDGALIANHAFTGSMPPSVKVGAGDVSGDPPQAGAIYDWIISRTGGLVSYNAATDGGRVITVPVGFAADGSKLYAARYDEGSSDTVRLLTWDTAQPRLLGEIRLPRSNVYRVLPGTDRLVYLAPGGALVVVDPATGQEQARMVTEGWAGGPVNAFAYSPAGDRVALAQEDFSILILDAASLAPLCTLRGHTDYVRSLDWAPDGQRLASGSNDSTVRLWDAQGCSARTSASLSSEVTYVRWSPDGKLLGANTNHLSGMVWDVSGGSPVELTPTFSRVNWLSDSAHILTSAIILDVRTGSPTGMLSEDGINTAAIDQADAYGGRLAGASGAGIQIWEPGAGGMYQRVMTIAPERAFSYVEWSPDGSQVLGVGPWNQGWVAVFDSASGALLAELDPTAGPGGGDELSRKISAATYVGAGPTVAVRGFNDQVSLWTPGVDAALRPLQSGLLGDDSDIALSPDGAYAAVSTQDGLVFIWDLAAHSIARTLDVGSVGANTLRYSADGRWLIADGLSEPVALTLLDAVSGEQTYRFMHALDPWGVPTTALLSPDTSLLATGLAMHDRATGHLLYPLPEHARGSSLAWSPQGDRLAVSVGSAILILDAASGALLDTLTGHTQSPNLMWSPDGTRLVSWSTDWVHDGTARVWQVGR